MTGEVRCTLHVGGDAHSLPPGDTVVGRSRESDLVISDPSISRQHARLSVDERRVTLIDLKSSNGTLVNGHRVREPISLTDGDRIVFGETETRIELTMPARRERREEGGDFATAPVEVPPPGKATEPEAAADRLPDTDRPAPPRETPTESPDPTSDEILPDISFEELELPSPDPEASAEARMEVAGFWRRVAALLVDAALVWTIATVLSQPFGGPSRGWGEALWWLLLLGLGVAVPILGWSRWATTPGKRLVGLYVASSDGRLGLTTKTAAVRLAGSAVSAALLGLGFLLVAFRADRRALHDHLADTYVVRASR